VKIFLDHCVPKRVMYLLTSEHEVRTAQQMGWAEKKNGVLLSLVEPDFDVFLTVDQNIKHQQNLSARDLRFIVLIGRDNTYPPLSPLIPKVKETLLTIRPGELVEVS
jgi:hypothetical protein